MCRSTLSNFFIVLTCWACQPNGDTAQEVRFNLFGIQEQGEDIYAPQTNVIGQVSLKQVNDVVTVIVRLENQQPGTTKAVHIHDGTCESPGLHWNQNSTMTFCNAMNMGDVWAKPSAGDIGNVRIRDDGTGELILTTNFWKLNSEDDKDIMGKVIVVHDSGEDFAQNCFSRGIHDHDNNPKIGCGGI
ncbi:MAG: superoxide dismutase family protein [Cyclobacteriaceae bacterium]|nr:superoxide dismutase family protein [Cyclobacteriaceae bacterium HetDA_MAG_MS6]